MRLWMIQPKKVYDGLQRRGRLTADGRRIDRSPQFRNAYAWMAEQMRQRIGPPPHGVTYPLWAWARWEGTARPNKPDLRSVRHMEGPGTYVRIEIDVPASRVLLSDFEAWHCVLNGWYLSWSETEDNEFHKRYERRSEDARQAKIMESWNRIFVLDGGDPEWRMDPDEQSIQATFWELSTREIVGVTVFEGLANKPD